MASCLYQCLCHGCSGAGELHPKRQGCKVQLLILLVKYNSFLLKTLWLAGKAIPVSYTESKIVAGECCAAFFFFFEVFVWALLRVTVLCGFKKKWWPHHWLFDLTDLRG